jgi:arabinan endo-1,5-alpha-L-arabinosidase
MKHLSNRRQLLLAVLFVCSTAAAQPIVNPVINHDFPDPAIINANGKYYGYATNSVVKGKYAHIQLAASTDLQHWADSGDALPGGASWANRDYWAPHVVYDSDRKQYIMFYAARSANKDFDMCIGVAFADNPCGPFVDKGTPLIAGKGYVNIDPFAMIDQKSRRKLLYWGSDHVPIQVQELSDDWKSFKPGTRATPVVFPALEREYSTLVEGPWVDYHKGYYYMYYSGDNCCGPHANYAVMIARAKNAIGPFQRLGEANSTGRSVILEKDEQWIAPGHNAVFKDNQGNMNIAFHAIKANGQPGRVMLIKRVLYRHGWPVVEK